MREKYNTLKITDLRSIVKGMGIKGTSTMNKEELVDILVEKEKEYNGVSIKERKRRSRQQSLLSLKSLLPSLMLSRLP